MKNLYKALTLSALVFLSFAINKRGQTKLATGDILIKSINPETCDFSLVTLVDLAPGTSFIVANFKSDTSGNFSPGYGAVRWINDTKATIRAGSEILFHNNASLVSHGMRMENMNTFNLSSQKKLFVFQKLSSFNTYITGVSWSTKDSSNLVSTE